MHAASAQPKVEIGIRVFRANQARWEDHGRIKLPGRMARLLRRIVKGK